MFSKGFSANTAVAFLCCCAAGCFAASERQMSDITVAAYYYSCTHPHPGWEAQEYPGFTEWDLVKKAKPRFPGHIQPKVPLWGYQDESDPSVMAQKIDAAADYGVDAFIFDWYYYENGQFLEGAIDRGFLKAPNNNRMKFCLMWANHDWYDIQGYNPSDPSDPLRMMHSGVVDLKMWDTITGLAINRYFKHPSYWKIDGKPYFSIYDMQRFIDSFSGADGARKALDDFREKAKKAGFPGIHVNAIEWGSPNLPGAATPGNWPEICDKLKLDSLTGYTWVHHGALNYGTFPVSDYVWGRDRYLAFLDLAIQSKTPYFPNTTVNWDNSPRAHPDADWSRPAAHVVNPVMQGNTPAAFKEATALIAQRLLESTVEPKVITVNAWNEWPEGSCLEPTEQYGYGYLEAIKDLFGAKGEK